MGYEGNDPIGSFDEAIEQRVYLFCIDRLTTRGLSASIILADILSTISFFVDHVGGQSRSKFFHLPLELLLFGEHPTQTHQQEICPQPAILKEIIRRYPFATRKFWHIPKNTFQLLRLAFDPKLLDEDLITTLIKPLLLQNVFTISFLYRIIETAHYPNESLSLSKHFYSSQSISSVNWTNIEFDPTFDHSSTYSLFEAGLRCLRFDLVLHNTKPIKLTSHPILSNPEDVQMGLLNKSSASTLAPTLAPSTSTRPVPPPNLVLSPLSAQTYIRNSSHAGPSIHTTAPPSTPHSENERLYPETPLSYFPSPTNTQRSQPLVQFPNHSTLSQQEESLRVSSSSTPNEIFPPTSNPSNPSDLADIDQASIKPKLPPQIPNPTSKPIGAEITLRQQIHHIVLYCQTTFHSSTLQLIRFLLCIPTLELISPFTINLIFDNYLYFSHLHDSSLSIFQLPSMIRQFFLSQIKPSKLEKCFPFTKHDLATNPSLNSIFPETYYQSKIFTIFIHHALYPLLLKYPRHELQSFLPSFFTFPEQIRLKMQHIHTNRLCTKDFFTLRAFIYLHPSPEQFHWICHDKLMVEYLDTIIFQHSNSHIGPLCYDHTNFPITLQNICSPIDGLSGDASLNERFLHYVSFFRFLIEYSWARYTQGKFLLHTFIQRIFTEFNAYGKSFDPLLNQEPQIQRLKLLSRQQSGALYFLSLPFLFLAGETILIQKYIIMLSTRQLHIQSDTIAPPQDFSYLLDQTALPPDLLFSSPETFILFLYLRELLFTWLWTNSGLHFDHYPQVCRPSPTHLETPPLSESSSSSPPSSLSSSFDFLSQPQYQSAVQAVTLQAPYTARARLAFEQINTRRVSTPQLQPPRYHAYNLPPKRSADRFADALAHDIFLQQFTYKTLFPHLFSHEDIPLSTSSTTNHLPFPSLNSSSPSILPQRPLEHNSLDIIILNPTLPLPLQPSFPANTLPFSSLAALQFPLPPQLLQTWCQEMLLRANNGFYNHHGFKLQLIHHHFQISLKSKPPTFIFQDDNFLFLVNRPSAKNLCTLYQNHLKLIIINTEQIHRHFASLHPIDLNSTTNLYNTTPCFSDLTNEQLSATSYLSSRTPSPLSLDDLDHFNQFHPIL